MNYENHLKASTLGTIADTPQTRELAFKDLVAAVLTTDGNKDFLDTQQGVIKFVLERFQPSNLPDVGSDVTLAQLLCCKKNCNLEGYTRTSMAATWRRLLPREA